MKQLVLILLIQFSSFCLGQEDITSFKQINNNCRYDFEVNNAKDLLFAIKNSKDGDTIYIENESLIDLSNYKNIKIERKLAIISGGKIDGALLFTNNLDTSPLFNIVSDDVIMLGLRVRGPDSLIINTKEIKNKIELQKRNHIKKDNSKIKTYGLPNSVGILIESNNVVIQNCEIESWSHSAIRVVNSGNAVIQGCYIHDNKRAGLGYGVLIEGVALIRFNVFNKNRHAIACTGVKGSRYIAEYNVCLKKSSEQGHIFDVHGGKDRKEGNSIAGLQFIIRYNLFHYEGYPLFKIRGKSTQTSKVYNNFILKGKDSISSPNSDLLFQQVNALGNFLVFKNIFIK